MVVSLFPIPIPLLPQTAIGLWLTSQTCPYLLKKLNNVHFLLGFLVRTKCLSNFAR